MQVFFLAAGNAGGQSAVKSNCPLFLELRLISCRVLGVIPKGDRPFEPKLPGCLLHAGDLALVGKVAEADTADAELTQVSVG